MIDPNHPDVRNQLVIWRRLPRRKPPSGRHSSLAAAKATAVKRAVRAASLRYAPPGDCGGQLPLFAPPLPLRMKREGV